eukprot:403374574
MYFPDEIKAKSSSSSGVPQKFNRKGLVAMANKGPNMNGSAFFITLSDNEIQHLNNKHTIFGQVVEGLENLDKINNAYSDNQGRPYQNIRIKHTMIIEDPFEDQDLPGLKVPSRSPSPIVVRKQKTSNEQGGDFYVDEDLDECLEDDVDINALMEGKTEDQIQQEIKEHQTKTRAAVLEIVEDLPDADIEPPKNVLFVCKLNPVTQDGDLRLIFSRFGPIKCCEIVRDWKTGDSLQYAFIEFENEESCIEAYSRMEGVAIDERRIHIDFSQSVAKEWNQYRRKMLKTAADQILEQEQARKEKERQVYNLFSNYKNKDREGRKDELSGSRSRDHRRNDKDYDRKKENDRGKDRDRRRSRDRDYDKHRERDRAGYKDRKRSRSDSRNKRDKKDKKDHKSYSRDEEKYRERRRDRS